MTIGKINQHYVALTLNSALYDALSAETEEGGDVTETIISILSKYAKKKQKIQKIKKVDGAPQKAPLDALLPEGADPFAPISEVTSGEMDHLSFKSIRGRSGNPKGLESYIQSFGEENG